MSWSPQVPLPLLCDTKLGDHERVVLIAIISHVRPADARLTCWPSNARLAEMTGRDKRSVQRVLQSLEAKGYVTRVSQDDRRNVTLSLPYAGWGVTRDTPTSPVSPPHVTRVTPPTSRVSPGRNEEEGTKRNEGTRARNGVYKVALAKAIEEWAKVKGKYDGADGDRYLAALERFARQRQVDVDDLRASA